MTGKDDNRAYGDFEEEHADRYARTREFMQIVRPLWTQEDVTLRRALLPRGALDLPAAAVPRGRPAALLRGGLAGRRAGGGQPRPMCS